MKKLIFALLVPILASLGVAQGQPKARFPRVTPPPFLATIEAEAEWMALNYWSAYDFTNPEQRYSLEANRQGFLGFISTLYATNPTTSIEAVEAMMERAAVSEEGYWYFLDMAETVLYDPNSPLRNDLLWEPFLRHATGPHSALDADSQVRYKSLLTIVARNQQGTQATDFVYTLASGTQGRMHNIKSPLLLLFFYNPDCSECAYAKGRLEATGILAELHSRGVLKVLAIYPDDDLTAWRNHLPKHPGWWISAYDKGGRITQSDLYDLKAIPTFYLLGEQKQVMMKDPTLDDLIEVLAGYL